MELNKRLAVELTYRNYNSGRVLLGEYATREEAMGAADADDRVRWVMRVHADGRETEVAELA